MDCPFPTNWKNWETYELAGPFERYWASHPVFSRAKLNSYRHKTAPEDVGLKSPYRIPTDYLFDEDFPECSSNGLRNPVHPFFQPSQFITRLPMDEVHDVLNPALQLASKFLTEDASLSWFAHVKYATLLPNDNGPGLLVRRAEPFIKEKLDCVKDDILRLANSVPITFAADLTDDCEACAIFDGATALEFIGGTDAELAMHGKAYRPKIFVNTKHFYTAMWLQYYNRTPNEKRCFQLFMATTLIHEFAHIWIGTMHRTTHKDGEPFICIADPFPEAGLSWEQHIFGGQLGGDEELPFLTASSFASIFVAPRQKVSSVVPMSYVNKWFRESTWDNFAELHASGELLAPILDRTAKCVLMRRYCPTARDVQTHVYVDGEIYSEPCCPTQSCNTQFPYEDPVAFREKLLRVVDMDIKLAKAYTARHGQMVEMILRGGDISPYNDIIRRQDQSLLEQKEPRAQLSGGKSSFWGFFGCGGYERSVVKHSDVFNL